MTIGDPFVEYRRPPVHRQGRAQLSHPCVCPFGYAYGRGVTRGGRQDWRRGAGARDRRQGGTQGCDARATTGDCGRGRRVPVRIGKSFCEDRAPGVWNAPPRRTTTHTRCCRVAVLPSRLRAATACARMRCTRADTVFKHERRAGRHQQMHRPRAIVPRPPSFLRAPHPLRPAAPRLMHLHPVTAAPRHIGPLPLRPTLHHPFSLSGLALAIPYLRVPLPLRRCAVARSTAVGNYHI